MREAGDGGTEGVREQQVVDRPLLHDRGDAEDAAEAAAAHVRDSGPGELDRAREHERGRAAPGFCVEALEAPGRWPACVRDDDVQPAEVLRARVHDPHRLALDREVGGQRERAERGGRRAERLRLTCADRRRRTLGDELLGDCTPQTTARTADERDATLEPEVHRRR